MEIYHPIMTLLERKGWQPIQHTSQISFKKDNAVVDFYLANGEMRMELMPAAYALDLERSKNNLAENIKMYIEDCINFYKSDLNQDHVTEILDAAKELDKLRIIS